MTDHDATDAAKLEAALPTMIEAAYQLEARGYTATEIGDAFLLAATTFGIRLVGEDATAKILARLAARMAAGEKHRVARRAH
jgi:hypothetical protein